MKYFVGSHFRKYISISRYSGNTVSVVVGTFFLFGLLILSYASPYSDTLINIIGRYGDIHTLGVFHTNGGGGNGGSSIFVTEAEEAGVGGDSTYLDTTVIPEKIIGNYFLETVGWVTMENVELIVPSNMSAMTPWSLSGYAWSENAGYIDFSTPSDGSYDGVSYTPGTKILSGYAWSDNLGYLPFNKISVNSEFKNKTKVLGNIGGKKAFDIEYNLGVKFESENTTNVINTVRKNVALMTRNIGASHMNTVGATNNFLDNFSYYKGANIAVVHPGVKMSTNHLRSIIVEGGNIYINADILKDPAVQKTRSIIALKDSSQNGGNIYIEGNVSNIYASLVAEGSIFSGDQGEIYNDATPKLTQLPKNQLYIYGTVISRNTIGGSSLIPNPVCPFIEINCTYTNSYKYDYNYFRSYDPLDSGSVRSDKAGYDEYSVIIEIDPRINQSPPPGMENIQ